MSKLSGFKDAEFVSPTAPSFAELRERILANEKLKASRQRDLISSVSRMAQILRPDRPLTELPADPEWCRIQIARILPASLGITAKTWSTLTSDFGRSLVAAGITVPRFEAKLSGEWATLWERVLQTGDMQLTTGLSRLPRFCQLEDIQPGGVSDMTLALYAAALRRSGVTGTPDEAVYRTVRAWNLAADRIDGWPQCRLTPPDRRRSYAIHWSAFPPSLESDVNAWLAMGSDDDIFRTSGPRSLLSPSTVVLRKGSMQRFATALVKSGHPIETLTDLRILVQPELAETGLRWLHQRAKGKVGGGLGNIAITVKVAAKQWVGLPQRDLEKLAMFAQRLSAADPGMTAKNRARLDALKDPKTLLKLLRLPETLVRKAKTVKHPARKAALFETATAIALLIACPIRFDNLCNLEVDKHFEVVGRGRTQRQFMRIPKATVKNRVDLNFEVPPAVASLIAEFTKSYRATLMPTSSRYLFTKRSADAPIDWNTLRRRITDAICRNVGVRLTPHNFRHVAAFILLSKFPGGYEQVRRLLGHKNGSTALDHYVGLENDAAHRIFVQLLSELEKDDHE